MNFRLQCHQTRNCQSVCHDYALATSCREQTRQKKGSGYDAVITCFIDCSVVTCGKQGYPKCPLRACQCHDGGLSQTSKLIEYTFQAIFAVDVLQLMYGNQPGHEILCKYPFKLESRLLYFAFKIYAYCVFLPWSKNVCKCTDDQCLPS